MTTAGEVVLPARGAERADALGAASSPSEASPNQQSWASAVVGAGTASTRQSRANAVVGAGGESNRSRSAVESVQELFERKDFSALRNLLAHCDKSALAEDWTRLSPIQKAALFKLMPPDIAMEFFQRLASAEKYFLLTAFDLGSIAPILENAPAKTRALFYRLPDECYDVMMRQI